MNELDLSFRNKRTPRPPTSKFYPRRKLKTEDVSAQRLWLTCGSCFPVKHRVLSFNGTIFCHIFAIFFFLYIAAFQLQLHNYFYLHEIFLLCFNSTKHIRSLPAYYVPCVFATVSTKTQGKLFHPYGLFSITLQNKKGCKLSFSIKFCNNSTRSFYGGYFPGFI